MEISLNNENRSINSSNLLTLLTEVLGEKTKGTAVAVNDSVVPKTEWDKFELKENDKVIIIKATQGG
ncbi:MAG TPA: sulfur carrier protein ThiS [Bacteroidia bacterium]|nr:sulfur carrier protein ThiS [Bacteroidia bacterium]